MKRAALENPEIEAATRLLEVWDGDLEELAWAAELLSAIGLERVDARAVEGLEALAGEVCRRARAESDGREIEMLEKAIAIASRPS